VSGKLRTRTLVELYKDGHREIFHRTSREVLTHADTAEARSECETCQERLAVAKSNPEKIVCGPECMICNPSPEFIRRQVGRRIAKGRK
jgi:hypothetical protein